jgi:hypothetical protein
VGQDQPRARLAGRHRVLQGRRRAPDLEALGFHVVGYGCTTCIGNSGPVHDDIARAVKDGDLVVTSVLSGNRNFEGRVNPVVRANYLASPPLVVAYALAGTMNIDFATEPIGHDADGKPVMLPTSGRRSAEVAAVVRSAVTPAQFTERYAAVDRRPRRVARAAGADRRDLRVGRRLDLHPQAVVLRRPAADPGAADRHRGARCSRSSATRSPPITSRRPATSPRTARPRSTSRAHGVAPPTTTSTARAAATTR